LYQIYSIYNVRSQLQYVSNYSYCRISPKELLYDPEHDLLVIAKFVATNKFNRFTVNELQKIINASFAYQ